MRLFLCMLLVGASAAIGLFLRQRLLERTNVLTQFIGLLEEVTVRMTYTSSNLAMLFSDNFAGYAFSQNQPFSPQFCEMTRRYKDVLSADDIRLLDDFTNRLGDSDTESQLRHFRFYLSLLTEHRDAAREEVQKKGKLCLILPLSAGLAAAILMV